MAVLETELQVSFQRDRAINQRGFANGQHIDSIGSGALGNAQFLTMHGVVFGKDLDSNPENPIVPMAPADNYPTIKTADQEIMGGSTAPVRALYITNALTFQPI